MFEFVNNLTCSVLHTCINNIKTKQTLHALRTIKMKVNSSDHERVFLKSQYQGHTIVGIFGTILLRRQPLSVKLVTQSS